MATKKAVAIALKVGRERLRQSLLQKMRHGQGYVDSSTGYLKVSTGKGGRQISQHRLVLQAKLGRPLKADEVTHHINENKLDNRPENLEVLTKIEHKKLHKIMRLLKSLPRLKLVEQLP